MAKTKSPAKVNPRCPVLVNAANLITQRLDELLAYEPCLDNPDNVYELHEMRIAGKRLRYTMEVFQPVYIRYTEAGTEFIAILQAVKNLQEHLGILHDADVLVPQILEHLGRIVKDGYGLPPSKSSANERKGKGGNANNAGQESHAPGSGKQKNALPIVGVHQVDYAACEGLLTLCAQIRADRDAQYVKLTQEWQQMRAEQTFERLRNLVREGRGKREEGREEKQAPVEETGLSTLNSQLSTEGPSTLNSQPSTNENSDAANRQIPQIQRAPGEPGHVAAARRRVPPLPEKGSEPEQQERQGRQRRDASAPARTAKPAPPAARNGTTRAPRHPRPGANTDSGAGESGAE